MTSDRLLRMVQDLRTPRLEMDQPAPGIGQLWRASWLSGDRPTACTVVVTAAPADRLVHVCPVADPSTGDESTAVLEAANGMNVAAWAGLDAPIHKATLEHRIADLTPGSVERLLLLIAGDGVGDFPPVFDELDDRAVVRADLADRLDALLQAEWLPTAGDDARTLGDLLATAGLSPSALAAALGVTPGAARRLARGESEPTPEQVDTLAELLGASPQLVVTYESDLVEDLDEPEFRPAILRRAERQYRGDEIAARRAVAGELMALAARHREAGARNWKALIRDGLNES
jgi:transcriptional regulator with XRE-family HTH domain